MTTLLDARTELFARSGIDPDGGYAKKWVKLPLGPIAFAIPNTKARKVAVPFHDLHHVLTGYATDWKGEFEISAWEIASGCADKSFAWMINLQGFAAGTVVFPGSTFRAFIRGLRTENLYRRDFVDDALLGEQVDTLRESLRLSATGDDATASETMRYVVWAAVAWVTTLGPLMAIAAALWWLLT